MCNRAKEVPARPTPVGQSPGRQQRLLEVTLSNSTLKQQRQVLIERALASAKLAECVSQSVVLTGLLENDHGLWRGVDWQGAGPLHRAVAAARHAVTSSGVGEPQTLQDPNSTSAPRSCLVRRRVVQRRSQDVAWSLSDDFGLCLLMFVLTYLYFILFT